MHESAPPSPASLLDRLSLIRMRPGLYLGVTHPNFAPMLERLDAWIVGYSEAVRVHQIHDPGLALYESFWRFLEQRIGGDLSQGTIATIRLVSTSDAEAWDTYWRLLDEFCRTADAE